ncbi:MAG: hypothetical protein JRJ45_13880 [Deltaproteobacteria bacterium]|nr:hypothetical protein [Deltaproteobacteria bacterium]
MEKILKKSFFTLVALCIPAGFLIKHEHAVFLWHKIPSIDAIFGLLGALLLISATRIVATFVQKKEDFYD